MGIFDRIRGRGKKEETSVSSEESFDLDDDALFGGDTGDTGEATFGAADDFGSDEGMETFDSLDAEPGDPGAAGTADFDGFDDMGGEFGDDLGGDLGDDFGGDALDASEPGAKGKKKKKKKAKKPRTAKAGRGKIVAITLGVFVISAGVGFGGGPLVMDTITGKRKLQADIETAEAKMASLKQKLTPLKRAAAPEVVEAMQTELAARQERQQSIAAIETKVADQVEQEAARDHVILLRDAAAMALAVRTAALGNVAKEEQQIEHRVSYLVDQVAQFEKRTSAYDDHVRTLQGSLPPAYADAATASATRTLSIQARLDFGASD